MISETFIKTLNWRISLMKYSHCTFLQWDKTNCRLILTNNQYKILSLYQVLGYMVVMGLVTIYFILEYLFIEWENGIQDVYDVAYQPRDEAKAALIHAAHAMYIGAFVLFGGCWTRYLIKRKEFVNFFNMSLEAAIRLDEKYKGYLENCPEAKRVSKMTDMITWGVAVATVFVPFFYGGLIFQKVLPENRIIVDILEIPLKFHWKLLPLSLPLAYLVLSATDFVFIFDTGPVIYFQCWVYWSYLLQPVSLQFENGTAKFTCRLGCVLNQDELVEFYEEQKALERCFNDIYGHWMVTVHHGSTLTLSTIGAFICIRHTNRLSEPGFQMAPLAVILCGILEYIETMFIVNAHVWSEGFIRKWRILTRNEKRRLKKVHKYLQAFRPIQAHLAYPYFAITKENFLEYEGQIADFLMDFLVATE